MVAGAVFDGALLRWRLEPLAREEAEVPITPCACLRCAPSAAALVNVRPHSGQARVAVAPEPVFAVATFARVTVAVFGWRLRPLRVALARLLAVAFFRAVAPRRLLLVLCVEARFPE